MGCEYNYQKLIADNQADAVIEVEGMIEQDAYECGHGGYTGTLAEADGVIVEGHTPESDEDAEEWLDGHSDKWGPAVIVKAKDGSYHVGANCSS